MAVSCRPLFCATAQPYRLDPVEKTPFFGTCHALSHLFVIGNCGGSFGDLHHCGLIMGGVMVRGLRFFPVLFLASFVVSCAQPKPEPAKPVPFDVRVTVPGIYGVRVEPVVGRKLSLPMGRLLARSVAEHLEEDDVPATTKRASQNRYVLKGRAQPNTTQPDVKYIVLIHWLLSLADGTEIGAYSQGVEGSWWQWENGDPKMLRIIGREVTRPVAAMIKQQEASVKPMPVPAIGLLLSPVTGAPGDGNAALTVAMRDVLQARDVTVTGDARDAVARLTGQVSVTSSPEGREMVRIVWMLWTLDGVELGRATQENAIPRGSLNGAWGRIAPVVAEAAVKGIERIFDLTGAASGAKPEGPPPPIPVLPRVPGRAPPPPSG